MKYKLRFCLNFILVFPFINADTQKGTFYWYFPFDFWLQMWQGASNSYFTQFLNKRNQSIMNFGKLKNLLQSKNKSKCLIFEFLVHFLLTCELESIKSWPISLPNCVLPIIEIISFPTSKNQIQIQFYFFHSSFNISVIFFLTNLNSITRSLFIVTFIVKILCSLYDIKLKNQK